MGFGELALKLGMLLVFFGVMIYVGFYCRKHSTDVNGFVLGGRSVGPWLTAFAYGTSYFSAVIFVGYAGQFGWKFGIAATWVGIGNALIGSLMACSIIIFIFMIPYTASLYNGLSRLFRMAFNIDYSVCVIVMAVLTAIYVIVGGYMATAVNDFIQGIIMLVGIVAVIAAVLGSKGGFMASLQGLSAATDTSEGFMNGTVPGIFNSFFGPDPLSLLGVVLLTSLGTWGLPQMVGKFYAIKSEGDIHKGTVISTAFAIIVAGGCYFLGGFGRLFSDVVGVTESGAPVGGYDAVIPAMLSNLPDLLIAIVMILVLSASMSTLSSLVLTSSSTVTLDLLKGRLIRNMDEKKQLRIMRGLIVVFIAISAIIAIVQVNSPVAFIAQAMGVSWGAMAGAFLAPFLYGLYWKGTTKRSCWASILFSCIFMTIDMLSNLGVIQVNLGLLQSPINAGAFCMIAGLILVPLISLITPRPDRAIVEDAFSSYDTKVLVRQANALADAEKPE